MTKYTLTKKQLDAVHQNGSVQITRNGKQIKVTPSMVGTSGKSSLIEVYKNHIIVPDKRDEELAKKYLAKWDKTKGPRVGDYIIMPSGKYERFSYIWEDGIQTSPGGQFSLENGFMGFSGSLNRAVPKKLIAKTNQTKAGNCWMAHHGNLCAACDVGVKARCRVYRHK